MSSVDRSRHGRYAVSIFVNGKRAQELNAGANGKVSTYWIESKPGVEFAIHVTEHLSATTVQSRVDIFADGKEVGKAILKPGETCRFLGSWLDRRTLRPFVFRESIEAAQLSSNLGNKIGSIQVKFSEVVVCSISGYLDPPPPLPEFDAFIKGKRLQHRIGLSERARDQQYDVQASRFTTLPLDPCSPDPIAAFDILYSPREYLVSMGYLAPCWSNKPQGSASARQVKTRPRSEEIEVAIDTMPTKRSYAMHLDKQVIDSQQNKRPRTQSVTIASPPCCRCAKAGTICTRLSGRTACSRCSDRKQGCNLAPEPRTLKNGSGCHSRKTTENAVNTSVKDVAERERSDTASDTEDSDTDNHSSDETYAKGKKPNLQNPKLAKGKTRNAKKAMFLREIQIDSDVRKVNELLNVSDGDNDISTSTTKTGSISDIDSGTEYHQSLPKSGNSSNSIRRNTKLPICEVNQATKLLATLRKWSDDLMEFVVDGDENGHIVVVAGDLIKELEGRFRSLQAELLKSNRVR